MTHSTQEPENPAATPRVSNAGDALDAKRGSTNAEALRYAERIAAQIRPPLASGGADTILRTVLDCVFGDAEIQQNFIGAEIRYTAMCGEVAREVLSILGQSPEMVGLLSVGDVNLPEFARTTIDAIVGRAHDFHRQLSAEETYGYDLSSRGSLKARRAMIGYFDRHYGFSDVPGLCDRLAENAAITAGGMRGLDDIATAHVRLAQPKGWPRFIHPDNSFGTWHSITQLRSVGGKVAAVHSLTTKPSNMLHLTAADVNLFYSQTERTESEAAESTPRDLWCVTPVGNPSGTRMSGPQLLDVCEEIVAHDPEVTILLDSTYVRTLPEPQARELMQGVVNSQAVLSRVIFLESFSKTHGLCGERIGAYFSANRQLFDSHHNVNMILSAGNGRHKSAMVLAIAQTTSSEEEVIHALHRFWQEERLGLYQYLTGNERFCDLFEDSQEHLSPDQLNSPLGLYLFLKLREGVGGKDVLIRTGCLGVVTQMGSGTYIRFSVGKITKPTYARHIRVS